MKPTEVSFLRALVADRPVDKRNAGLATQMASSEGVGSARGSRVFYTDEHITLAANILRSRGYDLTAPTEPFTRSGAPRAGSEKAKALRVTDGLVAVRSIGMGASLVCPDVGFVAMKWLDAIKLDYEVLMVCENLEPLMVLKEYRWLDSFVKGRRTLVLFRGTKGIFSTKFPAEFIAADTRPTLAFFDFDPAGLSMAASLPRREALCLPPMIDLEAAVKENRRDGLYAQSVNKCRARLDRVVDLQIGLGWIRMKVLACGLDQEGFPR